MLREWRQDFARLMRAQGVAANATPRTVRGKSKRAEPDAAYRTRRRGSSYALRARVDSIAQELATTRTIHDPAHMKLAETRKAVLAGWEGVAAALDAQGQSELAGDVRYFAKHLPPVRTDRERLAEDLIRHVKAVRASQSGREDKERDRAIERSR